jgi:hypothetical protein
LKDRWTLLYLILVFVLTCNGYSHHRPMISKNKIEPPPTVNPGPHAALIRIKIIDAFTGKQISATACVNDGEQEPDHDPYQKFSLRRAGNRQKGPIRFRPLKYYFYTDGHFEVRVPPGAATLELMKGYEYQPETITIDTAPDETIDLVVKMEKAIDMGSHGWYSGDTHIHMDRTGNNDDTLLTITSAKDIRYAYLLSMNTGGYDRGNTYESWLQEKGLGDRSVAGNGPYFISSGQEYRTDHLGHISLIMPNEYVPGIGHTEDTDLGPSLGVIADQTREREGFVGLCHGGYHHQEADGVLLGDKMDFLELLQFGGYRSLGLDGWYDFLNIGFHLPIVGACDFPYTRELGSEITYVWSDKVPTPRTFAEKLAEGNSFATSGPVLFLEVSHRKPGQIITFPAGTDTTLSVNINVKSHIYPVRYVELIVNGRIVEQEIFAQLKRSGQWQFKLPVHKSCWVAARTYAEAGTEAHTNPVYIYIGHQRPFNRDSARNIIARLDGSIESIPNPEIVGQLLELQEQLFSLLDGRRSLLPFPKIESK